MDPDDSPEYRCFVKTEVTGLQAHQTEDNTAAELREFCEGQSVLTHTNYRTFLEHQLRNVVRALKGTGCLSEKQIEILMALTDHYQSLGRHIDTSDTHKVAELILQAYRHPYFHPRHNLDTLLRQLAWEVHTRRQTGQCRSKVVVWMANFLIANAQQKLGLGPTEATEQLCIFMQALRQEIICTFVYFFAGDYLSRCTDEIGKLELPTGSFTIKTGQIQTVYMNPKPVHSPHNLEFIVTIVAGVFDTTSKPRTKRKGFPDATISYRFWLDVQNLHFVGKRTCASWKDVFDAVIRLQERFPAFFENARDFHGFPGIDAIQARYAFCADQQVYFTPGKQNDEGQRTAGKLRIHYVAGKAPQPIYVCVSDKLWLNPKMISPRDLTSRFGNVSWSMHRMTHTTLLGLAQKFTSKTSDNATEPAPVKKLCSAKPKEPACGSDGQGGEMYTHQQLRDHWKILSGIFTAVVMYRLNDRVLHFLVDSLSASCHVTMPAALTLLSGYAAQHILKLHVPDGMSDADVCDILKDCVLPLEQQSDHSLVPLALPAGDLAIKGAAAEAANNHADTSACRKRNITEVVDLTVEGIDDATATHKHRNKRLKKGTKNDPLVVD